MLSARCASAGSSNFWVRFTNALRVVVLTVLLQHVMLCDGALNSSRSSTPEQQSAIVAARHELPEVGARVTRGVHASACF